MLADPFPSLLCAHSRPIPVPSACTQATEALTWGVDFNEQDRIELFEAETEMKEVTPDHAPSSCHHLLPTQSCGTHNHLPQYLASRHGG